MITPRNIAVKLTRVLMKYSEKASMIPKMPNVHDDPITSSSVGNNSVTKRFHPKFATTAMEIALPLRTNATQRVEVRFCREVRDEGKGGTGTGDGW